MPEDINSPRVRQILAIHAEQAASAKADLQGMLADQLRMRSQRDELYTLVCAAAKTIFDKLGDANRQRGIELWRLARGLTDDPGPCPLGTEPFDYPSGRAGRCPVCNALDHVPF